MMMSNGILALGQLRTLWDLQFATRTQFLFLFVTYDLEVVPMASRFEI